MNDCEICNEKRETKFSIKEHLEHDKKLIKCFSCIVSYHREELTEENWIMQKVLLCPDCKTKK